MYTELQFSNDIVNGYSFLIGTSKYFGLNNAFLQKLLSDMASNKAEKKQYKQISSRMIKNNFYEVYAKNENTLSIDKIHNMPVYKCLLRDKMWKDMSTQQLLNELSFGSEATNLKDKIMVCCESLTALLYSITSLNMTMFDILSICSSLPFWTTGVLGESNVVLDNSNMSWQSCSAIAGLLIEKIRFTWMYEYFVALCIKSFTNCECISDVTKDSAVNLATTNINTFFNALTIFLMLMLHDKKTRVYFGELPYYMLTSTTKCTVSRMEFENFGKMFIDYENDKYTKKDDLIVCESPKKPEDWIFASNTIKNISSIYNETELLDKLHTNDMCEYVAYIITELNSEMYGNITNLAEVLVTNYNKNYRLFEQLHLQVFSNKFVYADNLADLLSSKQFALYNNPIAYKQTHEIGPSLLIRTVQQFSEYEQYIILEQIKQIGFMHLANIIFNTSNDDSILKLATQLNVDANELANSLISLINEYIESYYCFYSNAIILAAKSYAELAKELFLNVVSANAFFVINKSTAHINDVLTDKLHRFGSILENANKQVELYASKYKQSKAENISLKEQLKQQTKDYENLKHRVNNDSHLQKLSNTIKHLEEENKKLTEAPEKLSQIITQQKAHITTLEEKQSSQEQYKKRIRQLEDELARQEKLWQSTEETVSDFELTEKDRYILSHLKLDMVVLDCESTRRLQKTLMTNAKFNFIPRSKSEATQMNLSQNADIYLLSTNVIGHKDTKKWLQQLSSKSFRCVYSTTNGYNTLCKTILDKYYSMVEQNLIEPII